MQYQVSPSKIFGHQYGPSMFKTDITIVLQCIFRHQFSL